MKGKVLVFGSINTDLVTYVDVLPTPGETVTGGKFMSFSGGKGANQAVAAAAALSATVREAQTSMPSADDVDRFLSATRKEDDK